MKKAFSFFRKTALLWIAGALVLASCNVNQQADEQTFSFPSLEDSLVKYDSAQIFLRDANGHIVDTLFHGKVTTATNLVGLSAPDYQGGSIVIVIQGYDGEKIAYKIEKNYDGNVVVSTTPVILSSVAIKVDASVLKMQIGDTLPLPKVLITPSNFAAKDILWSSSNPTVLSVSTQSIKALAVGTTFLKASLASDTTKRDSVTVEISLEKPSTNLVDSISLSPSDTLFVALNGAAKKFTATVYPNNAPSEVIFRALDSTIATVSPLGLVRGLKAATTRIFAYSNSNPAAADTAWIKVLPKVEVDSIRFKIRQLELFQQGATENLDVQAYPALASQDFEFLARNPAIAKVQSGTVQGLLEGDTWIVAKSTDNPAKLDSILVIVLAATQVESVTVKPDTLKLYLKGESLPLKAAIYPTTLKGRFLWRSSAPGIADVDTSGTVSPVATGNAFVSAISRADSTKRDSTLILVKKDTPRLAVGPDTILSVGQSMKFTPVAPQDYGLITRFKWDLDGDGVYEDSSADLKEVSFTYSTAGTFPAKFYVRDSEGNDTTATRTVKAVTGLIVQITSPKDGFLTNNFSLDVVWSVDKVVNMDKETLIEGLNTVTRTTKDAAGSIFTASIKVTLDTKPPTAPKVTGSSPTSLSPKWAWASGGGGSGDYRFHMGSDPSSADAETKALEYTQANPASGTTYTLYVQERDAAGNWSPSGTLPITFDLTKPTVTITAPQASGTYLTRLANVDISGTSSSPSGPNAIKTVTYTLDGTAGNLSTNLGATGVWSIKSLPLVNNKTMVIKVTATDIAGNFSDASLSILMDNTAPTPPIFATQPPAIVNKTDSRTSLQWTWSRTGEATDSFVVKLNGVEVSRQTGAAYNINNPNDGDYQIEVIERDLAGNNSTALTSVKVLLDRTSPTAPDLTKPASPKKTAQWTWTTGGGGNGSFQCQLDGLSTAACTSPYNLTNPTDGDHSLSVRELDAAGNVSAWSTASVTIDLQVPVIAMGNYKNAPDQVINTIKPFSGTASDDRGLRWIKYHQDSDADAIASGTTGWSFTPALKTGTHTLTIYAEDLAGNQASTAVKITYEPAVTFVRKGATGSGDGTSWTNAYPELGQILVGGKNYSSDQQIWVTEGTYLPSTDWGFTIGTNSFVYGGFASEGTDRALSDRDLVNNQSILNKYTGSTTQSTKVISNTSLSGDGITWINNTNIGLSDFSIGSADNGILIQSTPKATLNGISMKLQTYNSAINIYDANVDIRNSHLVQNNAAEGVINTITGSGPTNHTRIQNVEIYANTSSDGAGVVTSQAACAGGNSIISENTNNEVQVYGGSFSREGSVTMGRFGIGDGTNIVVGSCPAPF